MMEKYEIRLGESLNTAWKIFCKGPEVFITLSFGLACGSFLFSKLGSWLTLIPSCLGPAAFYLAAEDGNHKERISFESVKPLVNLFPQLLALTVVKSIAILLGFILFVLPGIYLTVILCFAELFVVLEGKPFLEAMKASKELVERNFWGVLGLCIFSFGLLFSGILLVFLGLLVTVPLATLLFYVVFRRVNLHVVS